MTVFDFLSFANVAAGTLIHDKRNVRIEKYTQVLEMTAGGTAHSDMPLPSPTRFIMKHKTT
jgi:hypothetical protein